MRTLELKLSVYIALLNFDLEQRLSGADEFLCKLTGSEQMRARSILNTRLRHNYVLSHAAMHQLVQDHFGPDSQRKCQISLDGRPSFARGPYVSLSRAEGLAAIAICRDFPIGVDVAVNRPRDGEFYADKYPGLKARLRICQGRDNTLQFLRAWTELEAIAKLKSIPLEVLLTTSTGSPACLRTFFKVVSLGVV